MKHEAEVVQSETSQGKGSTQPVGKHAKLIQQLRDDVADLCAKERVVGSAGLAATANMIASRLEEEADLACRPKGLEVSHEEWAFGAKRLKNLYFSMGQRDSGLPLVLLGAHYDAVSDSPGADDNASSVAVLLELAHCIASETTSLPVQVELAFWGGEESPVFATRNMGSFRHSSSVRDRGEIPALVIVLEMVGCYKKAQMIRSVPCKLEDGSSITAILPETGDFLLTAGSIPDAISRQLASSLRANNVTVCNLGAVTYLHDICDARNWMDYPVALLTDTGMLRGSSYHTPDDRPETLDYEAMANIVGGLKTLIAGWEGN